MKQTLRSSGIGLGILLYGSLMLPGSYSQQKPKILRISYGDWVEQNESLNTKDAIERTFEKVRAAGYTHIVWRLLWEGHGYDHMVVHSAELKAQHERLKSKLDGTPYAWDPHEIRWPIEVATDWSRGVPTSYARTLAEYWAKDFDWEAQQAELNSFPQFTTSIDGQTIHFVHIRSAVQQQQRRGALHGEIGRAHV